MFNTYAEVERDLRARAERVQERAGDAHRARLLRQRSEARLLRRRRTRRAHRPDADRLVACLRHRRIAPGAPSSSRCSRRCRARWSSATHGTSLPLESNRVDLDPDAEGRVGSAGDARDVQGPSRTTSRARGSCRTGRVESHCRRRARSEIWKESDRATRPAASHLLGTCRMGNDPKTSVVDKYHRAHDVRNLFVCDGSSLVTSRPRPADDDDPGARVPRGRAHRAVREARARSDGAGSRGPIELLQHPQHDRAEHDDGDDVHWAILRAPPWRDAHVGHARLLQSVRTLKLV